MNIKKKLKKPRILLYSHDTYGLGHLRRSLLIASQVAKDIPRSRQLLLTGSMVAGAFGLPPRLDMVKLPALSKRSNGKYISRTLPTTVEETINWRKDMILQAVENFKPDLILVDKVAAGVEGELLPTLNHLKTYSPKTKIVLGMRDIEDCPRSTVAEWEAKGVYKLLDDVYDAILLYGDRAIFDPVVEYKLSEKAAAKVIQCGYLRRGTDVRCAADVRRELGVEEKPLVLVTVGGGGDGDHIVNQYLEMLEAYDGDQLDFHSLIVTGPLMPEAKRKNLKQLAEKRDVTFMEFTSDLPSYMAAADLVVSMAGYNTVCEILSLQKRALLIPRVNVRTEQLIRAQLLADSNWVSLLNPDQLTSQTLAKAITETLAKPLPNVFPNLSGLGNISEAIDSLLTTSGRDNPYEFSLENFVLA